MVFVPERDPQEKRRAAVERGITNIIGGLDRIERQKAEEQRARREQAIAESQALSQIQQTAIAGAKEGLAIDPTFAARPLAEAGVVRPGILTPPEPTGAEALLAPAPAVPPEVAAPPLAPAVAPPEKREDPDTARAEIDRNLKQFGITRAQGFSSKEEKASRESIDKIRKEVSQLGSSKALQEIDAAFRKVQIAERDPSPAGDLALIFNYMKILDPGSVVREGEFATAQNSAGVPDQIRNQYNRAIRGERLNPRQRKDFAGKAKQLAQAQFQSFQQAVAPIRETIQARGLPEEQIIPRFESLRQTPTPPQDLQRASDQELLQMRQQLLQQQKSRPQGQLRPVTR